MAVAPGEKIIAADIPIENIPLGRMVQTVAQSIPDATITALSFTTEDFDTHGFHDNATNNTRITPNVAGYYEFTGVYYSQAFTTLANMDAFWRKNAVAAGVASGYRGNSGGIAQSAPASCIQAMNGSTDYVELCAFQDSAGATNTNVSARFSSYAEWKYLRPL